MPAGVHTNSRAHERLQPGDEVHDAQSTKGAKRGPPDHGDVEDLVRQRAEQEARPHPDGYQDGEALLPAPGLVRRFIPQGTHKRGHSEPDL